MLSAERKRILKQIWQRPGYREHMREVHRGQVPWCKGIKTGTIPWNKGLKGIHLSSSTEFKKGMTPWNKGIKLSEEHIKNLSLSHKGQKPTKEAIQKIVEKTKGTNHWNWKGDGVGYEALHTWLTREYGKPSRCECVGCHYPKYNARGKLMIKPSRYEWANVTGKYLRGRENWLTMCPSCHRKYDYSNNIRNPNNE